MQKEAIASGSHTRSFFCYASTAKRFVLYGSMEGGAKERRLWLYGLEKNEWTVPEARGDVPSAGGSVCGYYDPARNVAVRYDGKGWVWVYRCKHVTKNNTRAHDTELSLCWIDCWPGGGQQDAGAVGFRTPY